MLPRWPFAWRFVSVYAIFSTSSRQNCLLTICVTEHIEKLLAQEKDASKQTEYENVIARIDDLSPEELAEVMAKYKVLSPEGKNVSAPFPFNLMFNVSIGPTGLYKG